MDRAARLAALNSYVYTVPPDELEAAVEAAGMELLAQGQNRYTRWFVTQGHLPNVIARQSPETGEASIELEPEHRGRASGLLDGADANLKFESDADMDWGVERLVFIRGVVWRDPLVDLRALWTVRSPMALDAAPVPGWRPWDSVTVWLHGMLADCLMPRHALPPPPLPFLPSHTGAVQLLAPALLGAESRHQRGGGPPGDIWHCGWRVGGHAAVPAGCPPWHAAHIRRPQVWRLTSANLCSREVDYRGRGRAGSTV